MRYTVQIQATITKWIEVDAETADQAAELAHECFDIHSNGDPERYEQDIISIERAN